MQRGNRVLGLSRVAMGSVRLDPSLPPGAVRPLTDDEERRLYHDLRFENAFFANCIPPTPP